jgi:hypothetical protein
MPAELGLPGQLRLTCDDSGTGATSKWYISAAFPIVNGAVISKGTWMFEMLVHKWTFAQGIGVIDSDKDMNLVGDVEFQKEWSGFYHGGTSSNVVISGERVHDRFIPEEDGWSEESRVGILVDLTNHALVPLLGGREVYSDGNVMVGRWVPSRVRFTIMLGSVGDVVTVFAPCRVDASRIHVNALGLGPGGTIPVEWLWQQGHGNPPARPKS